MKVSREMVAIGAADIGRMRRKKLPILLEPSSRAASSSSTGTFMKNCLRKNTANGVMSMVGKEMPSRVSIRPSCLMSTKFGRKVKMAGTIRPPRKRP